MKQTSKKTIFSCCALILVLFSGNAYAVCRVSVTSINFGTYDVFATSPGDSVGTITISCTDPPPGVYATVSIGSSANSGTFIPRKMKRSGGSDLLDYNLFTTSSRATVWGDGTAGTMAMQTQQKVRSGKPGTMNIYGRIPAGRDVSVGSYTDTLVVTVNP